MPRLLQAFTLDVTVINQLTEAGELSPESKDLQILLPELAKRGEAKNLELDASDLNANDYATLYMLLKPEDLKPMFGKFAVKSKRLPSKKAFIEAAFAEYLVTKDEQTYNARIKEMGNLQKLNRREKRKAVTIAGRPKKSRDSVVNASRIAEALLVLGLQVWRERVSRIESEGNKGSNAGQGQDKLSGRKGRKATAVRTV